jgi:nitric oxide synthase-interacting protein
MTAYLAEKGATGILSWWTSAANFSELHPPSWTTRSSNHPSIKALLRRTTVNHSRHQHPHIQLLLLHIRHSLTTFHNPHLAFSQCTMPPPKSVFTSYERNALKDRWGSQATRLTRDSFLPFGSCQLCLLPSVDPVCCSQGDLFCRECAMTNLLAQRKEMKRLEKVHERRKIEEDDQFLRDDEEAQLRAIEEFEAVQAGLEVKIGAGSKVIGRQNGKIVVEQEQGAKAGGTKGTKRKFEIDEEELKRIASDDRTKAQHTLDDERKAAKGRLPSFWVPGETPDQHHRNIEKAKTTPTCPSSSLEHPHSLSLKSLTAVNFNEEKSAETGKTVRTCPSCRKSLSNSTKAMVAIPCGHVLCKPCVDKFLRPEHRHHRDAHDDAPEPETVHCYACDADLTSRPESKKSKKDREKAPPPGLVEIRSEGTGFASGGKAVVKKDGVAFQV